MYRILIAALLLGSPVSAQESAESNREAASSPEALLAQATANLRRDIGTWQCRWEFLDADGKVTNTVTGTETFAWEIPDRVVIATIDVPDLQNKSVSLKFYKPDEQRLYFISVDSKGDLWTFTEPLGSDVMTSNRHANPAGEGDLYLRFTPQRRTDDEVDVLMESSPDQETWTKIFVQYMVRSQG